MTQSMHNGFMRDDSTGALVVSNSPNIQVARVNCGAMSPTTTIDVAVAWPVAFADTNYTVVATLVEESGGPSANADALRQIVSKTASGVTVRVADGTTGYSSGQLFVHAIAIHD